MHRRTIAVSLSLAGALLLGAWTALGQAPRSAPPAGDYPCLTSRMTFSPVQGPVGPLMIIAYDPSALGTLRLDGKGAYRTSGSRGGRYAFNRTTGAFTFVSGPLKGWPAAYEVADLNTLKRIDPSLDDARTPRVSPDGKRIAFVYHGHLWVMNLDGSGLKQATSSSGGEERPAWSPDGQSLAAATKEYGVVVLASLANGKIVEMKNREDRTLQSSGRIT